MVKKLAGKPSAEFTSTRLCAEINILAIKEEPKRSPVIFLLTFLGFYKVHAL